MKATERAPLTLAWWLGVRGTSTSEPSRVRWREARTRDGTRLRIARGTAPRPRAGVGAVLVVPGLHMDGPADARMRRLGAVLAEAGADVVMPHLDAFERLWIRTDRGLPDPRSQLEDAFDWTETQLGPASTTAFSVSFGAAPLLHLLTRRSLRRAVIFGGFATLDGALAFALDRASNPAGDPLNGPAIYRNLADTLLPVEEAEAFEAACLRFCEETWSRSGRPALKSDRRFAHALAEAAESLSPSGRELLYEATGLLPGAPARISSALSAHPSETSPFAWADAARVAPSVEVPVDVVHGRDDDVVPPAEGQALAALLPRGRLHLSGQVGHTQPRRSPLGELRESARILRALADLVTPPPA